MERSAEDRLVPTEGILGAGLLMVARLLLPSAFADALAPPDVLVSPADAATTDPRGYGGSPRRDHDRDCSALVLVERVVDAAIIVSTIADEGGEAPCVFDQRGDDACIIDLPGRQLRRDDLAVAVDSDVQLAPLPAGLRAVLRALPFARINDRQTGTVDDQRLAALPQAFRQTY